MTFTPVPKPAPKEKRRPRWLRRSKTPLKRSWAKQGGTPMPKVNRRRQERRANSYRKHLASKYWKDLRRQAYERDGGMCQCPDCIDFRHTSGGDAALTLIDIWFDTKGGIHGFHTHHLPSGYRRFGRELLEDVLTMDPKHHMRLERTTGLRKAFLSGKTI